jgi:glycerol-3-phosphate dehydrogenase
MPKLPGADVLNYTTVTDLARQGDRITGLTVHHQSSDQTFDVPLPATAVVANISGPWVDEVLGLGRRAQRIQRMTLAAIARLVARRVATSLLIRFLAHRIPPFMWKPSLTADLISSCRGWVNT